mgnify:CR=1 FL=1
MSEPLSVITGVVSGLTIHSGEEEFVRSRGQQAAGVGAAAGLAVEGLAGAAAGAGLAAASAGDAVDFFSCKVEDQFVEGRFSKASFKDGDELDVVTSKQQGRPLVLAARRAADHVIWMVPHCSRGVAAHRKFAVRMFGWLMVGLPTFFLSSYLILGIWANNLPLDAEGIRFMGSISLMLATIAALYFSIRFYRQWLPIAQQAEQIFAALGYPDPSCVDLPRDHKLYCKANDIKWPYLADGPWIYHYLDQR